MGGVLGQCLLSKPFKYVSCLFTLLLLEINTLYFYSFINEKQKSGLYILILDLKKNNSNNRLGHVVINKGYFDFYKTSKIRDWCVR